MAYTDTWDTTFESLPADSEEARYGASRIRSHKVAIRERLLTIFSGMNDDPLKMISFEIEDDAIAIELDDTGESDPAGRYRLLIDADKFTIQGRNQADDGWETVLQLQRHSTGNQEYLFTMSGNAPILELIDSGETTPAGKFRIKNDGDQLLIQGRNAGDDAYETILTLERVAEGGLIQASSSYSASGDDDLLKKGDLTTQIDAAIAVHAALTLEDDEVHGGPGNIFGSWTTKSKDVSYEAATDGILVVKNKSYTNDCAVYTDGSDPPTTERGYAEHQTTVTVPVRKGDFFKVTGDPSVIYWLPIG